ncbi:ImmA/IrrE family metallo-endopeptidase [Raineyella fluvialis]|uniref:ImmA/IrrE family metallo-endopeptidase n=1 Tax=Raineyella fluvialis TaxID=2662261 RepID=UPI001890883C|nr:ImmA/IrrE family metallo-endopeptidase [Raineyella fluvialis]
MDYYEVEPDLAVPTGEYVEEWLEDHEMTQAELARRTGVSRKHISTVISGAPVSTEFATKLELVTGVPAERWLALEATYRSELARLGLEEKYALRSDILDLFGPSLTYLREREVIKGNRRKPGQLILQLMAYFQVADPDALLAPRNHFALAFRQSAAIQVNEASVSTWLRTAELHRLHEPLNTPFDRDGLQELLPSLRSLSRELQSDPGAWIRALAGVGVHVIPLAEVKGCRAYGATYWSGGQPILVLSARGKNDGALWFTLFHELGHVLLHANEGFVEQRDGVEAVDVREEEANRFAEDALVPARYRPELNQLKSKHDVKVFAMKIGVSPGVVLQHLHYHDYPRWPHQNGTDLFIKVQIGED